MADDEGIDEWSRLFTVRIWSERVDGAPEHRGHVRDVATGAFANFRDWSGLTAFLAERTDESMPHHVDGRPSLSTRRH